MKKRINIKQEKRMIRHRRIKKRVIGTKGRPRLSVFRSNRYLYAQLIDDKKGITLVSFHEKKLSQEKKSKSKKEKLPKELSGKIKTAYLIGLKLAQIAQKAGISQVVFDRGGYKYHGRIKALAEGARAGGLKF